MIKEEKKSYLGLILQYWAQVLSLATILTSIGGIWSANWYYSRFHVNYTELAELNDFIKHVISRPYLTLVLVTLFISLSLYIYLLYRNNKIESEFVKFYKNQNYVKKVKLKFKYRIKDAAAII